MTTTNDLLDAARSELGYIETPVNVTKFAAEAGHLNGQPWCATFEVALFHRLGLKVPAGTDSAFTPWAWQAWRNAGRSSADPGVGAIAYFKFPGMSQAACDHTGIVESYTSNTVTTIDGNTLPDGGVGNQANGGEVCRKTRMRNLVVGYGRPDFTEAEPVDLVAPCQWLPTNPNGTEPYFVVSAGSMTDFSVASVDNAPFTPPWKDGQKGTWFEDFTFLGLWWRRVINTTGKLQGPLVYPDRVAVACAGGGVYQIAHRA